MSHGNECASKMSFGFNLRGLNESISRLFVRHQKGDRFIEAALLISACCSTGRDPGARSAGQASSPVTLLTSAIAIAAEE
jgi:hypothetical protein